MNFYGEATDGKCGWPTYSMAAVVADEQGHCLGLLHHDTDCRNHATGFYPCVNRETKSIMNPTANFSLNTPTACGTWVQTWIRRMYCGEREDENCACTRQTAKHDDRGRLPPSLVKERLTSLKVSSLGVPDRIHVDVARSPRMMALSFSSSTSSASCHAAPAAHGTNAGLAKALIRNQRFAKRAW